MNITEIAQVLTHYNGNVDEIRVIQYFKAGFINDVVLLEVFKERFVLKKRVGEQEKILEKNAQLVAHLANRKFPVTSLIKTIRGKSNVIGRDQVSYELYYYVKGIASGEVKFRDEKIKKAAKLFSNIDRELKNPTARLPRFPKAKFFIYSEIIQGLKAYRKNLAGARTFEKQRLFKFADQSIKRLQKDPFKFNFERLPYQITHGSLSDNNIIVNRDGDIKAIIDWDNIRMRPRIHSVAQQALSFSGSFKHTNFLNNFVTYLEYYIKQNPLSRKELIAIPDLLEYRALNRLWIFDHYLNKGQKKALNAIKKLTEADKWLQKNKTLMQNTLDGIELS